MFAVSRFSPIEWENEDPCDEAAGVDELTQELFIIIIDNWSLQLHACFGHDSSPLPVNDNLDIP